MSGIPAGPFRWTPVTELPAVGTHRDQLARERAESRARPAWWLRVLVAALIVPALVFMFDQRFLAPLIWGYAPAELRLVADNEFVSVPAEQRTAVIAIGGLGIRDAGPSVARPLRPALSEGIPGSRLYALREGTRLSLPLTYEAMDQVLERDPVGTVVFYGMSTGTKEMLYLAAYVRSTRPELRIVLIADSGPFDANSAYELRRNSALVDVGVVSSRLRLFGGPLVNSIVDLTSGSTTAKYRGDDGELDPDRFWAEVARVGRDVWSPRGTPNTLRVGQLALIVDASAPANLATVGRNPDGVTWFFYLAPGLDATIDGSHAVARYREVAGEIDNGLSVVVVVLNLPGLPHASERRNPDPYNEKVAAALRIAGVTGAVPVDSSSG